MVFDLEAAFRESPLPREVIERIQEEVRQEFPTENSLYELHVLRALQREVEDRMTPEEREALHAEQERQVREYLERRRKLDPSGQTYGPAGDPGPG